MKKILAAFALLLTLGASTARNDDAEPGHAIEVRARALETSPVVAMTGCNGNPDKREAAAANLAIDKGMCLAKCSAPLVAQPWATILATCAKQCGQPQGDDLRNFRDVVFGQKAGAAAAGAKIPRRARRGSLTVTTATGYLPSPEDSRDHAFSDSETYGWSPKVRKSIRVSPHRHVNQVGQSCVGHAVIIGGVQDLNAKQVELGVQAPHAIRLEDGTLKRDEHGRLVTEMRVPELLPELAPLFQYTGARRLWFRLTGEAIPEDGIPDGGSSYRLGIMHLRDVDNGGGAREDRVWPETPRNIPRVPPAHVDQDEPLVTVDAYSRIRYEQASDVDALRDGIIAALEGFERGECSKPLGSMELTEAFVNTKDGELCDDENPGKDVGGHAMSVGGYDEPNDAALFENSWPNPASVLVRLPYLAKRGRGGEFWVLNRLIYIPRRKAA